MTNLLRKIPVYLAAFSALLLPNAFAQTEKAESELVTIAEREVNGKTIEYKASQDVADHMKFLAGYASTLVVGYETGKFFLEFGEIDKEVKKQFFDACESLDSVKKDNIIQEEELTAKLNHGKCEVNKKLGGDLVNLISYGGVTYRTTKAIEEHFWAEIGKSIGRNSNLELEGLYEAPILGLEGRMKAFAVKADKNKDGVISADEYLQLRKEVMKKVKFSEVSGLIGPAMSKLHPYIKKLVERNWDMVEESYMVKVLIDIYRSPNKFVDENFSEEERKELKSINLENLNDEEREGVSKAFSWISIKNPSFADKTLIYTLMKVGKADIERLTKASSQDNKRGGLFSRDEPYVEKRVIREGPVVPQREQI